MPFRFSWLLPLKVFALHTLLLAACTYMVMRSPGNTTGFVFFIPMLVIDLPMTMLLLLFMPLFEGVAGWLTPSMGQFYAELTVWLVWLGVFAPLPWLVLTWWIGRLVDRRFVAPVLQPTGDAASVAPPESAQQQLKRAA